MKRILFLAVAAGGAILVGQRVKAQRAEADLWSQLTDEAPVAAPAPPDGPATAGRDGATPPNTAH